MAFRVQIRRDPSGKWTVNNPILLSGEFGYETDTTQIKIGDGVTPWIYLPYWGSGTPPITIVNGNSLFSTGLTGTGTGATNANYSIFLGNFAGAGAVNAGASTFFGQYAGAQAINALNSNFFGDEAGFNATHAEKSNFFGLQAGYGATGVEDEEFSSNFLGYQTGYLATDARYSNFIGHQAGYRATNANQSNFIGQFAGSEATNAQRSNFLGEDVGYQATNASFSNFLGSSAGNQATDANHSNFIGHQAGYQANNANHSNFIGREAGYQANNAYGSNFIGSSAGYQATNAINSIFFGTDAGSEATNAYQSNFFGQNAGRNATNAFWSNFIGLSAGYGATNANNSNFLGYQAGYSELLSFGASYSNFLGNNAGYESNADHSNFLGTSAGYDATDASYSNFFGYRAGWGVSGIEGAEFRSNFLGYQAGEQAQHARDSNFIGYQAGDQATYASFSNFIGHQAGYGARGVEDESFCSNFFGAGAGKEATNASYSNLLGNNVGSFFTGNNIGSNNIIIGTNISLPDATANAINLGGVLFGTGTHSDTTGDPSIIPISGGKIGIGVVEPTNTLHIYSETEDTSGLRLERLTSASPTNTGQAIGVDASGNVVTVEGGGGSPITIVNTNSLFSTGLTGTGTGATGATDSNFFGNYAGENAINASSSNFFGVDSGRNATNASGSNFLGNQAGWYAASASNSNFLGDNAGYYATGSNKSNFMGQYAGYQASSANNSNFIGFKAGYEATNVNYSNFIGYQAGYQVTGVEGEEFRSNFIGYEAGRDATNAADSNFFGFQAGQLAINANNSNFIGQYAGSGATSANYSNFIGTAAGEGASNANHSNLLGLRVGASFTDNNIGSNNIIIGTNISLPDATANSLNIGGILFGTGTYSDIVSNTPSITPTSGGKIGIGVVEPTNTLHIYSEAEDTSGLRLERLTSASPTSTGQAIGVDASGNVVTVTGSGVTQTLAETLVLGNNTGGTDILLNNADRLLLENNSYLKKGTYDFGASGGISRVCGASYEDMWQNGFRHVFDASGFIRNSTNCFNLVPTVDSDSTRRYKIGSIWTLDDLTNYICTDATEGAAVWELYKEIPTAPLYKVYTALLSQSGSNPLTSMPTAIVLENTLGFTLTWVRDNPGYYVATFGTLINIDKITAFVSGNIFDCYTQLNIAGNQISLLTHELSTGNLVDDKLARTAIEIRVYN